MQKRGRGDPRGGMGRELNPQRRPVTRMQPSRSPIIPRTPICPRRSLCLPWCYTQDAHLPARSLCLPWCLVLGALVYEDLLGQHSHQGQRRRAQTTSPLRLVDIAASHTALAQPPHRCAVRFHNRRPRGPPQGRRSRRRHRHSNRLPTIRPWHPAARTSRCRAPGQNRPC